MKFKQFNTVSIRAVSYSHLFVDILDGEGVQVYEHAVLPRDAELHLLHLQVPAQPRPLPATPTTPWQQAVTCAEFYLD